MTNINYHYNQGNIPNTGRDVMTNSFETQESAFDSIVNELFNYNLYGRYKTTDLTGTDSVDDTILNDKYAIRADGSDPTNKTPSEINTMLLDNLNSIKDLNHSTIEKLGTDSNNINNTYNHTSDMLRNQLFQNNIVESESNNLINRNYHLLQGLENKKRHNEIYIYYYKKNKKQLQILYYFLLTLVFIIILTFLNKQFGFLLNNLLYTILVIIICFIYFIYFLYSMYDILLRDNIDYDEYNQMFWNPSMVNSNKDTTSGGKNINKTCLAYGIKKTE